MNEDEQNAAQLADDQEWEQALTDFKESKGINDDGGDNAGAANANQEELTDEQKAEKEAADKKAADEAAAADAKKKADEEEAEKAKDETPEQTEARHKQEAEDKKAADEAAANMPKYDAAAHQARRTSQQIQQERKEYVSNVREKLYPDLKTELLDSEGKPIRSVADLTRLENPNTGKAFTEEEATIFLNQAEKHLANQNALADAHIEQVADVLITIRDESLAVREKWGALLVEMDKQVPGFSVNLRERYKQLLDVDSKSNVIVGMKMGPEEFYDTALAGYELAAKQLQEKDKQLENTQQEQKQTQQQLDKARNRSDRGDITGNGKTETKSDDDKEWDQAIDNVFGDRIKKKK